MTWGSEHTVAPLSPGVEENLYVWSPATRSSASCWTERGDLQGILRKIRQLPLVVPRSSPYPLLLSLPQFLIFLQHLQDRLPLMLQQKGEIQILCSLIHWFLSLNSTSKFSQVVAWKEARSSYIMPHHVFLSVWCHANNRVVVLLQLA